MMASRVYATSVVHIDYQENFDLLTAFAKQGHGSDAIIVAGDATDRMDRLQAMFEMLVANFALVLFVPGNHELWLRRSQFSDSLEKLYAIQALCESTGVTTKPVKFGHYQKAWLVPLLSWYDDKDQPQTSLYLAKDYAEDRTDDMWGDFLQTRWPSGMGPKAHWLAQQNELWLEQEYDHPVISFSHFLPRQELVFQRSIEESMQLARRFDPLPEFNFTRVAGSARIDWQLRRLGSKLHIYGHQHRNRIRHYDGVTYLSHCMGYPKERSNGSLKASALTPICVWRDDTGFCVTP